MRWVYLILLLAIVAVIVAFVLENREDETVMFFNQKITAPLSVFFVAAYLLGMWSGGTVVGFMKRAYRHATEHEQQKQTAQGG
jgi:uncharacterized integral membrane protein